MKKLQKFPKLIIKDTGKYGKGVFAGEDIKEGTKIFVLGGKIIDSVDLLKRINSKKENIDDPFQIGKRTYIDLNEYSRSFNHSCDPVAGIRKKSEMFAIKDIKENDEITYDYSLTIAPTEWKMKCRCGSKNCRKTLGDISSVPKKQIIYYQKKGALQTYMKPVLNEVIAGTYRIPKYEIWALEKLKNINNI